ncbi:hypothetical protein, partial [Schlesneria sp.]|uniref:hypothetical protein n=1 Tax=Schlesneria sp. TaxID=2762018 RepID=UPI002F107C3E
MDAAWLATVAAVATLCLLLLVRSNLKPQLKQMLGVVWAVGVIGAVIGLDGIYPGAQRRAAVGMVQRLGGSITQDEDGSINADLGGTECHDADLKRLLPRLKYFSKIGSVGVNNTSVTDSGLDAIGKTFQGSQTPARVNVTGSQVTPSGVRKLQRTLDGVEVLH